MNAAPEFAQAFVQFIDAVEDDAKVQARCSAGECMDWDEVLGAMLNRQRASAALSDFKPSEEPNDH